MAAAVFSPLGDPSGTLSVAVHEERGELVLGDQGAVTRFALAQHEPARLGWHERRERDDGSVLEEPVSVGEVLAHCLGEWDAEERVIAISERAAARAALLGGAWAPGAARLRRQVRAARRQRQLPTVLFRKWWEHLSDERRLEPLNPERGGAARRLRRPRTGRHESFASAPRPRRGRRRRRTAPDRQLRNRPAALPGAGTRPVELGL